MPYLVGRSDVSSSTACSRPKTLAPSLLYLRAAARTSAGGASPSERPAPRPVADYFSPPTCKGNCRGSRTLAAATRPSCRPSCAAATLAVAPAEEAGHMAAATRSAIIALQPSDLSRPQVRRLLVHCMLSAPGSCAFPSPSHGGSADRNGWRFAEPKRICTTSCLFLTVHSAHGQAAIQAKLLHCTRRFQHQPLCQCPHPTSRLNVSAPSSALCPRGLP